jgi:hypothetical protein
MITLFDTTSILFRLPKDFGKLAVLSLGMLLPSCSPMPPPQPVVSAPPPPPSVQALRQAEEKGYAEGYTAGKKVQARHDRAVAAELAADAAAKVQPPAQVVQIIPPPATPAPVPVITPATPPTPAQNSYNSSGPAQPLGNLPPAF